MSKNTKKKNAIRFGALAVAALLFLGVFSAWAQGADAQASAEIGEIEVDGIHVEDATGTENLLEGSIAGRPGTVNAADDDPYSLFEISEDEDEALTGYEYIATVYLTNGAELVEEGVRYLTLEIQLDDGGETNGLTETAVLTLDSGQASFTFEWDPPADETIDVDIIGGSWATYPFADFGGTAEDTVDFMIDIEPTRDMSE